MKVFGRVYLAWNVLNGKVYVGQTRYPVGHRWNVHCSAARTRPTTKFYKALRFHGPESFKVMVLAEAYSLDELNQLEEKWIAKLDACDRDAGYNQVYGGLSYLVTDEVRAKMSASAKGKIVTAETRAKLSLAGKGRPHTKEHAAKIGAALRGRVPTLKARAAVAEANRTRIHSEATRAKLRLAAIKANMVRWHS